ncbi:MAG TPA: hypothetical protein VIY27_08515 [Myxococcota bacterium]
MLRLLSHAKPLAVGIFVLGFALGAQAEPAMFKASFVFQAWGNDVSSGVPGVDPTQYTTNDWTAAPLGYDCQHAEKTTVNGGTSPRWCPNTKMQRGHPVKGTWTRSIGAGAPPAIVMEQSDFGTQLALKTANNTWGTGDCCRGFLITFPPYLQSFTYATFVNAAGSFFAGGGAAAGAGYVNKFPATQMTAGTWLIRAGKNAFGGVMGLLGKYGATGKYTVPAAGGATYNGVSSWAMVKDIGRSTADPMNPYTKTDKWYRVTKGGKIKYSQITAIGSGTLWTTGQVGGFAKTGAYFTILWRTGYDNRTSGGLGNIQLVTPTLTHWLSQTLDTHTAQIGMLKLTVTPTPEPGALLLLAAGGGVLGLLYWTSRRV